jgi:hypothetical protein
MGVVIVRAVLTPKVLGRQIQAYHPLVRTAAVRMIRLGGCFVAEFDDLLDSRKYVFVAHWWFFGFNVWRGLVPVLPTEHEPRSWALASGAVEFYERARGPAPVLATPMLPAVLAEKLVLPSAAITV